MLSPAPILSVSPKPFACSGQYGPRHQARQGEMSCTKAMSSHAPHHPKSSSYRCMCAVMSNVQCHDKTSTPFHSHNQRPRQQLPTTQPTISRTMLHFLMHPREVMSPSTTGNATTGGTMHFSSVTNMHTPKDKHNSGRTCSVAPKQTLL
jgi:hypothetical protein